jgi:CobQ/CobB/MinD/ParA nucleotide binding domain.
MKTIAFYSYKGGVGRTLALVNIANRLAEFGKKVCIIDFDLEAPGLECKYQRYIGQDSLKKGIVDYIHKFATEGKIDDIKDYALSISLPATNANLNFIPAGNSSNSDYWKKLSRINWWNLFYEKDSMGIQFFLNMKEQIKDAFDPDFLLIDNRTGITETSALTMSLLSDSIVVLAANNQENITGSQRVIDSLMRDENNLLNINREIHFVLTRVPMPNVDKPDEKTRNEIIIKQKYDQIETIANNYGKKLASTNVIHSDRRLEENEQVGIYVDYNYAQNEIDREYLLLYSSLTKNDFTEEEKIAFEKEKIFQKEFKTLLSTYSRSDGFFFWELSDILINEYRNDKSKIVQIREIRIAFLFKDYSQLEKALHECDLLLKLDECNYTAKVVKARALFSLREYGEAYNIMSQFDNADLLYIDHKLFKIQTKWSYLPRTDENISNVFKGLDELILQYPQEEGLYNEKAYYLCSIEKYQEALDYVYKALELNTEYGLAYSTLAEIKYLQSDINEFYRNLELGLKYGFVIKNITQGEVLPLYKTVVSEERFQNLLRKYNQEDAIQIIEDATLKK